MNPSSARTVVDALIGERLLDPASRERSVEVVAGALQVKDRTPATATSGRPLPRLVEVVAYFGGALVLAAGTLFLAQEWDVLGFRGQVIMLAVVMAILATAGVVTARMPSAVGPRDAVDDSRRRLAGTLFTGAAVTVAFLAGLVFERQLGPDLDEVYWPAVAAGVAGLVVCAIGYRLAPTALGVLAMLAFLATSVLTFTSAVTDFWNVGLALFLVGVLWLALAELGVFREGLTARGSGVATALLGAQLPVIENSHAWLGYLLTLVVVVGGTALYLRATSWPYLAAVVVGVTLVVPEIVSDWTDGSLGAIGAVLVTGVTLLAASFAGYRLREGAADEGLPPVSPTS